MQKALVLSPFNLGLVAVGLIIMSLGLYRISPLPFGRVMASNAPLGVMTLLFLGIMFAWYRPGGLASATVTTIARAGQFLPLMILLCAVMGIGAVVAKWHEDTIQNFLVQHHIVGPVAMSFLTPTSNALVPMIETAWKVDGMRPWCLYYLQASAMVSVPLFMLRATGFSIGSPLPMRMYVMGFVTSIFMLVCAKPLYYIVEKISSWFT